MDVSLQFEIPVIFEVLTVLDIKDALERATREKENKGSEAALTALEMIKTSAINSNRMVFVIGHALPDVDSAVSAIVYA